MDVRCEKCQTEYDFDDARVTEAGVTVKCTQCGFVFKVKKRGAARPIDELPPELANVDKTREWKIRQSTGNIYTCRELTTLQKWIVERKVSREDEISLTGETWKRLGNIPELAGFFIVVEQAAKAAVFEQQIQSGAYVPSSPSMPAAPPGRGPTPEARTARETPAWNGMEEPSSPGRQTFVPPEEEAPDADDLAAIRGRSSSHWLPAIGGIAAAAVLGYLGYTALVPHPGPPAPAKVASKPTPPAAPTGPSGPTVPTAPTGTTGPAAALAAPLPVAADGGTTAVAVAGGPGDAGSRAFVDAGAVAVAPNKLAAPEAVAAVSEKKPEHPPVADREERAPAVAAERAPPKPHGSFEGLMAQGRSLEEHDRAGKALDAFMQAIELKPTSAEAWVGKANCLLDLERDDDAVTAYKQALTYAPGYSDAQLQLASIYKRQGKRDQAIRAYKTYLAEKPSGPDADMARRNLKDLSE